MTKVALDELVTRAEIARRLGVSRQRAHQLSERGDFPGPAGTVGRSTVWRWPAVESWARTWDRRGGRPSREEARDAR